MEPRPIRFIGEPVQVEFDQPAVLEKKPECPDRYYDRAPKDAGHRKGAWFLFQELAEN